jgi:hypothetical protein
VALAFMPGRASRRFDCATCSARPAGLCGRAGQRVRFRRFRPPLAAHRGSQPLNGRRLAFEICGAPGRSQRIRIAAPCICEFTGVRLRRLRRRASQGRRAPRCWRNSGLSRRWPRDLRGAKAGPRTSGAPRGWAYTPPTKSGCFGPTVRRPAGRLHRGPRCWRAAGKIESAPKHLSALQSGSADQCRREALTVPAARQKQGDGTDLHVLWAVGEAAGTAGGEEEGRRSLGGRHLHSCGRVLSGHVVVDRRST